MLVIDVKSVSKAVKKDARAHHPRPLKEKAFVLRGLLSLEERGPSSKGLPAVRGRRSSRGVKTGSATLLARGVSLL